MIYPQKDKYLDTVAFSDGNQLKKWCDVLNNIHRYTDKKRLLEVGVGKGELLAVALELGYETEAVELVPETAQSIANLLDIPIWNCDFLNFNPGRTYSVITMGDVIEHISDPNKALKKAYELLEDEGVLWLSTPNFESSFSRLYKFRDPMWKEPFHITYFSYHGIQKLLSKNGFEIFQYNVSNRYNGSMELIVRKSSS